MDQQIPRLLFVGAGNIAQSIMRGIIKAQPQAAGQILATAPTPKNLDIVKATLGCKTTLLLEAIDSMKKFQPDFIFLCMKPQVLMSSIAKPKDNILVKLLNSMPIHCTALSLVAGIKSDIFINTFHMASSSVVRVMLNTAAEIGSTSVLYHAHPDMDSTRIETMERLFGLIGQVVVRLNDEKLIDVGVGVCGSGIAFFYEMIQAFSDIGVKNGLNRSDATLIAAQLSKSAGEMLLAKKSHPYQLRDDVSSPAGTTIYGLSSWHEHSTSQRIGKAIQASIDRATHLSSVSKTNISTRDEPQRSQHARNLLPTEIEPN